jgi:hypothetical protein
MGRGKAAMAVDSEPYLRVPPSVRTVLLQGGTGPGDIRAAGRIADLIGLAVDPGSGVALATSRDARIRVYDYPSFRLRRSVRLEEPLYLAVLDPSRGKLYAAASDPAALLFTPLGEREHARGDLLSFDVGALLRGAEPRGGVLRPKARLPLYSHIHGLVLSPDGRYLYYQSTSPRDAHLGRVDTTRFARDRLLGLMSAGLALALSPDGKQLYIATSGRLMMLDTSAWRVQRHVQITGADHSLAAANEGRVYLSERRDGTHLYCLDMCQPAVLAHWTASIPGNVTLRLAPGGSRLFLAANAVSTSRIWALDVHGTDYHAHGVRAEVLSDRTGVLRGQLFVTPDGRYLINGSGQLFRLSSG